MRSLRQSLPAARAEAIRGAVTTEHRRAAAN